MLPRHRIALAVACLCLRPAAGGDLGQLVASQVSVDQYRFYLDDRLYTHFGDNRGRFGPEHDPARQNIVDELVASGLSVELHPFTYDGTTYYNVVGTLPGFRYPDEQFIVGAHFDSANTPGADDNASGVAGVLELARVLSACRTERTVKFIAFDIEELGLYGSFAYAQDHAADDIRGMISMDMIAHDVGTYTCEIYGGGASTAWGDALAAAVDEYGGALTAVRYDSMCASDDCPFRYSGFQACLLIEGNPFINPCYHQPCDSVDQPGYISYSYAADLTRSVAGFLAEQAVARFPGDLNCDGSVNGGDIGPFVLALSDPQAYASQFPACNVLLADTNGDGSVNGQDIGGFVELLGG